MASKQAGHGPPNLALWALGGLFVLGLLLRPKRALAAQAAPAPVRGWSVREVQARIATEKARYPKIPLYFALANAEVESGFRQQAWNPEGEDSIGVYQINWRAHEGELRGRGVTRQALYDPDVNVRYAFELMERSRRAAIEKGYGAGTPEGLWIAARLHYNGVPWSDFGADYALAKVGRFQPVLRKWAERTGGR